MKQRMIRIIKILLGAYLIFIGSAHFINIYDQKPSDMHLQIMIALFFVIMGIGYMVWDVRKLLERFLKERAIKAERKKAEERVRKYKELHSSDKFRTAPMRTVKPISLEKMEEDLEDFSEDQIMIHDYEEEEHAIIEKSRDEESKTLEKQKVNIDVSEEKDEEE